MKRKFAIIVAGGKGVRMNANIPKQFLSIDDEPILIKTIEKFVSCGDLEIILVLPEDEIDSWKQLCREFEFVADYKIVAGGRTRFESVKNGLDAIPYNRGTVAVHDGVRPYVSPVLIEKLLMEAEKYGSAIPFTFPKESIREVDENGVSKAVDRSRFRMIQTPQCFDLEELKEAYLISFDKKFTDDASVYEHAGHQVHLVEGEYSNIKITTPEDIKS